MLMNAHQQLKITKRMYQDKVDTEIEIMKHEYVDEISNFVIERIIKQNQVEIHPDITFPERTAHTSSKFNALIEDILKNPHDQSLIFCEYIREPMSRFIFR